MTFNFYDTIIKSSEIKRLTGQGPKKWFKKIAAQKIRERLTNPEKKWNDYINAYQNVLDGCSKNNQWVIVPADEKWYRNYLVATTIVEALENLKMKYPKKKLEL